MQKIDQVKLLGPREGNGSRPWFDCDRYSSDLKDAKSAALDPEIASDALGYDVKPGEYDIDEVAAAIMRLAGGW